MDYNQLFHLNEERERPTPVTLAPTYPLARELHEADMNHLEVVSHGK